MLAVGERRKENVETGCGRRNNGKEKKRKTNKMRMDLFSVCYLLLNSQRVYSPAVRLVGSLHTVG
jgi:hypothetical protein